MMNYWDMVLPFLPQVLKAMFFLPMMAFDDSIANLTSGFIDQVPGITADEAGDLAQEWTDQHEAIDNPWDAYSSQQDLFNQIKNSALADKDEALQGEITSAHQQQQDYQDQAMSISKELLERQIKTAEEMSEIARSQEERSSELWDVYKENYLPGEIAFSKELFAGIRPDLAVNKAVASTQRQFQNVSEQQGRLLRSLGINPSSPRYQNQQTDLMGGIASARAGAANIARADTANMNRAMKTQAVAQGQGYPGLVSGMATGAANILSGAESGVTAAGTNQANLSSGFASMAQSAAQSALNRQFSSEQSKLADLRAQAQQKSNERMALWGAGANLLGTGLGFMAGGPWGAAAGGAAGGGYGNTSTYTGTGQNSGQLFYNPAAYPWGSGGVT